MNIYLLFIVQHTKKINQYSKNLHKHKEISAFSHMSCPLFTLCPEEGDFQARILQISSPGMVHLYKTAKKTKSNHVKVISPLQSQPTYRHPQFSLKGSRRALSKKKEK